MKPLLDLIAKGGPAMIAIIVLSVLLYSRCCKLLLTQWRATRRETPAPHERETLQSSFRHQRIVLGAMIAAAPLLGLLGTVSGMVRTFESLSAHAGEKSMEGLARGISEVLVATESGLLVALPALLLVYLAHRGMLRRLAALNGRGVRPPTPP